MTDSELRQLDAAVHREVMGMVVKTDRRGKHWTDEVGPMGLIPVPHYTADIRAAWLVVAEIQAKNPGWRFSVLGGDAPFASRFSAAGEYVGHTRTRHPFGWHAEFFGHEDPAQCTGRRHGEGWADTAPLAICLAALAVLTPQNPEGK